MIRLFSKKVKKDNFNNSSGKFIFDPFYKIHNFYLKKFKFYRTWHEQPNSKKIHKVTLALFALIALASALYVMPFSPFRAKAASDSTVTISNTEIGTVREDLLGGNLSPWGIYWPSTTYNNVLTDSGFGALRWGHAVKIMVDMEKWNPSPGVYNWNATGHLTTSGQASQSLTIDEQIAWLKGRNLPVMYTLSDEISCAMTSSPTNCRDGNTSTTYNLDYNRIAAGWVQLIKRYIDAGVDVRWIEIGNEVEIWNNQGIQYPPVDFSSYPANTRGFDPKSPESYVVGTSNTNDYIKLWEYVVPALKAAYPNIEVGPYASGQGPIQTPYYPYDYLFQNSQNKPDFYAYHHYPGPGSAVANRQTILDWTWQYRGLFEDFDGQVKTLRSVLDGWGATNAPIYLTEYNYDSATEYSGNDQMWDGMFIASALVNSANGGVAGTYLWDTFDGSDTGGAIGPNYEARLTTQGMAVRLLKQFKGNKILSNTVTSTDNSASLPAGVTAKRVEALATKDGSGNYKTLLINKNTTTQHVVNLSTPGLTNNATNIKVYATRTALDTQTPTSTINTNLSSGSVEVTLPALSMAVVDITAAAPTNIKYVSKTNCSDSNAGTEAQPWCTIQKAANTVVSGDIVYVKAGTYDERVTITKTATSGSHIVFHGWGSDRPYVTNGIVLSGSSYIDVHQFEVGQTTSISLSGASYPSAVAFHNTSYSTFDDFQVRPLYQASAQVSYTGNSNHNIATAVNTKTGTTSGVGPPHFENGTSFNEFKQATLTGIDQSSYFFGENNLLQDLTVVGQRLQHDAIWFPGGGNSHSVNNTARRLKIYNFQQDLPDDQNEYWDIFQIVKLTGSGDVVNFTIDGCVIGSYRIGTMINAPSNKGRGSDPVASIIQIAGGNNQITGPITIQNSSILQTGFAVISVNHDVDVPSAVKNVRLFNNYLARGPQALIDVQAWPTPYMGLLRSDNTGWEFKNNIVDTCDCSGIDDVAPQGFPAGISADGNVYLNQPKPAWDTGSKSKRVNVSLDNIFVNPDFSSGTEYGVNANFHLKAGGDAIDAGVSGGNVPNLDAAGVTRSGTYDAGPFNYDGGGGTSCTIGNGDVNGDTHVNISDAAILMAKWNQNVTNDPADVNCSGKVDISDAAILMARWGS